MNDDKAQAQKKMIAVVITTYNNPKSLELCLLSLGNQTYQNFEVFIADDGSKDETRDLIQAIKNKFDFQIYHCWQPDVGYRKAKINNTVFRQIIPGRFPITLCLDHDVILHHRFVEDHYLAHAKENFKPLLFMGRRVDLSPELSTQITPNNVLAFNRGLNLDLILSGLKGETKNVFRSFRMTGPGWLLTVMKRDRVYDLLGSNYSVTTAVLNEVNGYNEDFHSYWGEDGDLYVRIRNSGVKCYGLIGYAIQWHLYHKRLNETPEHVKLYQDLLHNTEYKKCINGINKVSS